MLKKSIQTLPSASFALVMATGIIATASQLQGFTFVSTVLFWLNNLFFFVLLLLFIARLALFFPTVTAELRLHEKGTGFLTIIASSCILGTEYAQAKSAYGIATMFWVFAGVLWVVLVYTFLAGTILKRQKPSPETGMNGSWLLLIVCTQSVSILGGVLSSHTLLQTDAVLCISLLAFLLGVMLYFMLIAIDLYRLLFFPMKPEEAVPSYWINMGAAAITALSGITLSKGIQGHAVFGDLYSFVKAMSIMFWAMGSFWIPVILIMDIWRYAAKKWPLKYEAAFWSLVFPLGMYTVCSWRMEEVLPLPFLQSIAKVFIYIAWAAWLVTFIGMCVQLAKQVFNPSVSNEN
ncbi:tellurite resistance/C4-dicarboxylate transporter family protein [Flavisolibacter ginsenosidimutans]|uniref:C4-dicarboxylate ABC transporter n=1 Tax=Flavisolibacter ginsenosidimutans TaxID=661481 RepID=A0A5B8UNU6_9BACT|nr:tellurite resistance/C4-dicarboxylate transporter family protein [Flavisolibacter ginsenosidimutans]QEC58126.1 C4-dicarboxylate ABC transporter [Flavisolibacter ginsenosidimutans]